MTSPTRPTPDRPPSVLRRIIAPLASLKLTVLLIALSIILVFTGTLAQRHQGIWDVLHTYFRAPIVFIPLDIFLSERSERSFAVPFPGGYTIGLLMLLNLIAAHALRFRVKARGRRLLTGATLVAVGVLSIFWFHSGPLPARILSDAGGYAGVLPLMLVGALFYAPLVAGCALTFARRAGIVLIHASLMLLLAGEGVTAATALETQMPIYVGATSNWSQDIREVELVLIDPSSHESDLTIAISQSALQRAASSGELIANPAMPVAILVDRYFPNSDIRPLSPGEQPSATAGFGVNVAAVGLPRVTGVDRNRSINVPAAIVTLLREGLPIGTYLVSPHLQLASFIPAEQEVRIADRPYRLAMRFRRFHKLYSMRLDAFHHDLYPATNIPKNFSSDIHISDPARSIDHEVKIKMNNPLRFEGETFFQSGYIPANHPGEPDLGTVLSVVKNPGWTIPYIACAAGLIGLVYQFGASLIRFLRRSTP